MINIIGLGYIGLPTALMFANNGLKIIGTDTNKNLIDSLNQDLDLGVKVFDPFIKNKIIDNQFMDFKDFLDEIELLVIMVAHDHIKSNMELIKDKIILDTKNICSYDGVYKL